MNATEDPRWLALSHERREELLEKHREVYVEGLGWWDSTYDNFVERVREKGIEVGTHFVRTTRGGYDRHSIYFSGFWSQGDGACFEGSVQDWDKALQATGYEHFLRYAEDWSFKSTHSGHYCPARSMEFSVETPLAENPHDLETDPLQHDAWALVAPTLSDLDAIEGALRKLFIDLADELYRDLENEYEYLTSTEVVVEWMLGSLDEDKLTPDADDREEEEEFAA